MPPRAGILLIEMREAAAKPHLVRTADLRRASERLLGSPDPLSKRLNLRERAARVHYRLTGSKFEQSLTFYQHARAAFPDRYRALSRLKPPAVLKVNLKNDYPRFYVTRQIRADNGFYFGPFLSRRIAEAFSEGFLDLFKTRRCQIKIRRDPKFPGCIYSEMKMCLAPCFAGCSREEYDAEVWQAVETLATKGQILKRNIEHDRQTASEALEFEHAATLHKRLEKISAALHGVPEIAQRIDDLNAVILQRAAEEKTIAVFPVQAGLLADPMFLRFSELSSQPRSVEAILRESLEGMPRREKAQNKATTEAATSNWRADYGLNAVPAELSEHLSLISRWFYSKPREGEIFFREGDWPYRRILRACNRLLASFESTPSNPSSPGTPPAT